MFESEGGPAPEPDDAARESDDSAALADAGLPVECPWPAGWDELPTDRERLAGACQQSAGIGLMLGLVEIDVRGLTPDDAVTFAQQWDRAVSWAAGAQAAVRAAVNAALVAAEEAEVARQAEVLRQQNEERVAAGSKPRSGGFGFVPPEVAVQAELAAALRLSPRSVSSVVQFAVDLAGPWRPMRAALLAGDITENHAKAIGRVLTLLPAYLDPELVDDYVRDCSEVLAVVVPYARTHTPGQAAKKARDLITAIDPVGTKKRRQEAADREHGVFLNPREPGTSELMGVMPTETARAIYDAVRRLAGDARFQVSDGCVTIGQRRVAALKTLVLGDPGQITVIDGPVAEAKEKAHITVIVSLETVLGVSEQGGRINGEPVTADVIRDLIAACDPTSTIRRLVTDTDGVIVDYGRSRYIGSDLQKHVIRLRDGHCRGVGCTRPAEDCEIGHARLTVPVERPVVACEPLGERPQLAVQRQSDGGRQRPPDSAADGSCTWRSPLGRIYEHQPPPLLPPAPRSRVIDDGQPPPF